VKGRTAWLVTLPIALIGLEIAHAIANAAFGSPAAEGEVFASPASGAQLVPMLLALALALIVVGLVARTAGWWWSPRRARSLALPFACLAPTGFVLLELVEGLLHEGAVSWARCSSRPSSPAWPSSSRSPWPATAPPAACFA